MSIDTLYAESIEQGLTRWARNPGPDVEPSFSITAFTGAGLKGFPSAALERGGLFADVLSAFGTAAAASDSRAGGMFSLPTDDEQKQQEEARQKILRGEAFDFRAGNALRAKAQEFAADPLTSHTADQVMHGLVRFGAKAVGDVLTMGPAGALVTGLDEGNTVAQNLRVEGVDAGTAAQVGAVQGGIAAAGVVLPLAGKTIMQTLGLVAVGGPGSYVAQEALSRKILEEAGYNDQASLHNPFDPLGLAISTVIPGGFGAAHAVRLRRSALERVVEHIESGGQRFGPDGKLLTSPKGAQGEMQVMPGTARDPGFGVAPARDGSPEELARVGRDYLAAMEQRYPGDVNKALAAYNAGPGAVDKAVAKHGDAWLKNMPRETQEYVHKAHALGVRATAETAARSPEAVDAARVVVLQETVARSLPDTPDAMAQVTRAADIVAERGGRAAEAEVAPVRDIDLPTFREWFGESKVVDEQGAPLVVYHGTSGDFDGFRAPDAGGGIFFSTDPQRAGLFAGTPDDGAPAVVPVRLQIENPMVVDGSGNLKPDDVAALIQQAKAAGHDGLAIQRHNDWLLGPSEGTTFVAFKPEQAKSAIGNSGKFDPNSPSLTDPLAPGERSPREAANSLPPADSVKLAGDEPPKRGAEMGSPSAGEKTADVLMPPEVKAAQELLDSIKSGGVPLNPAKLRGIAEGLGLDVSKKARPEETIQRIKEAVARAEDMLTASRETDTGAGGTASLDAQIAAKLATEQPDLQVILPGSDTPISVKEAMARIAQEQAQDTQWADLVRVAAECSLGA